MQMTSVTKEDEMVVLELDIGGMATLRGRAENEWLVVPYWPCSGRTVRKMAPDKLPKAWVDEVAAFADDHINDPQ